jgi:hypothetical protein
MQSRSILSFSLAALALPLSPRGVKAAEPNVAVHSSVAIVELFTSEGCSSCPPADALLRQINLMRTAENQLIVGISEHVTYWNDLGWKDPYSSPVFTDRQNTYAERLSLQGPYTPQMVLNGRDQFVGSDGRALQRALAEDARRSRLDLHILSFTRSSSGVDLTFAVNGSPSHPLDVVAVVTDDADRSNVLRGENSGRSLQHVSVARVLVRVATIKAAGEQTVHVSLPDGLQLDGGTGHHLVLFAQEPHQGEILGADTRAL